MKRLLAYTSIFFSLILYLTNVTAAISVPDQDLYINSPELSKLEKVKNIKNKKARVNKYNQIYIGQKGLVLHNGYGILKFEDGGIFVGYFHKGTMRDGSWIIKGMVNYETFEYVKKNKPKKDSNGVAIVNKTEFIPAKEFEIEYLLENVFLKKKISYEKYLKLTGKDKLLAKKEQSKPKIISKEKEDDDYYAFKNTGFNIYDVKDFEGDTYPYVEAYFKDDCIKHGLVRYVVKETNKSGLDIFGIFNNCRVVDPLSKVARVSFDENGELLGMDLYKKDVSHLYGNRPLLGVRIKNTINKKGIEVIEVIKDKPLSKTDIKKGDILLEINNNLINSVSQFIQLASETKKGDKIRLKYIKRNLVNENFEFDDLNAITIIVEPYFQSENVALHVGYNVRLDLYFEGLTYDNSGTMLLTDEVKLKKGTEAFANRQAILKEEFFELKRYYDGLRKIRGPNVDNFDYSKFYIVSNKKINDETLLVENQKVFEPEKLKDTNPPIITVSKNISVDSSSYQITGSVSDDTSNEIYIEIDGIIENTTDGKFIIKRFSPVSEKVSLVAIDKWGNRSKPSIVNIEINRNKSLVSKKIERLNPSKITKKSDPNKVALIIGIEQYKNTPKAAYANLDAKYFYEYAKIGFGVNDENIKLLVNDQANLIDTLKILNKWLPGKIKKNQTELIIYFAGHGLASNDGKELYLLPQDGDSDLLFRTGISRTELFSSIRKLNPKNVIIFLDTCYSGVSRDDQALLASARPVRIIANDQEGIPNNFSVFSASQLDQISSGLSEAKHGIFSYYLMKGLEGQADSDQDKKITNGELLAYMDENVSQKAAELGRQQNPSLAGDPDKILISYR